MQKVRHGISARRPDRLSGTKGENAKCVNKACRCSKRGNSGIPSFPNLRCSSGLFRSTYFELADHAHVKAEDLHLIGVGFGDRIGEVECQWCRTQHRKSHSQSEARSNPVTL